VAHGLGENVHFNLRGVRRNKLFIALENYGRNIGLNDSDSHYTILTPWANLINYATPETAWLILPNFNFTLPM